MRTLSKILIMAFAVSIFTACESSPFTGYIVGKKYVPEHQCCSETNEVLEAVVHVPVRPVNTHQHHKINADYVIFVANHQEVQPIHVSPSIYNHFKILDKVCIKKDSLILIKRKN
jgi:hypothetical protein